MVKSTPDLANQTRNVCCGEAASCHEDHQVMTQKHRDNSTESGEIDQMRLVETAVPTERAKFTREGDKFKAFQGRGREKRSFTLRQQLGVHLGL